MNETTSNKKLTDEEYVKPAKGAMKQMFKQFIFAVIMTVLAIPATLYIIFGSDENIKVFAWTLLLLVNIPTLLRGVKITIKTKNSSWFVYTISLIVICTLIMSRIFGVVDNTTAITGFFILSAVAMIPFFFPKQKDIFRIRNIVIREGEKIDVLTDDYSERPYTKESEVIREIIKNLNFKEISLRFAKLLGKEGIIIDYVAYDGRIKMFPTFPFDGDIGALLFLKKRDSYIEINKTGSITVFVSKPDYLQIVLPVSHSMLCRNIAEKFEQSFIEFAKDSKDNKGNAIKILRGEK